MKITVIGATGMVGSRLVTEAADRGHVVTAASRNPGVDPRPDVIASVAVDVRTPETLAPVLAGADAVVLAIRPVPGDEHTLAPLTAAVLDAADAAGTAVLIVGGAGPLRSPNDRTLLVADDPAHVPAAWQSIAAASTAQLRTCQQNSSTGWVYLSPPAILEPGTRTGRYRRGTTTLLTDADGRAAGSAEDLAVAVVDELERPGAEQHFTIAHAQFGSGDARGDSERVRPIAR